MDSVDLERLAVSAGFDDVRAAPAAGLQVARQIHCMISAITSPNSSSTPDHSSAETKLAI